MITSGYLPSTVLRIGFATLAVVLLIGVFSATSVLADDAITLTIETSGAYAIESADLKRTAHELAVFYAIRKAVEQAADRFEQQKLIQFVDRDKSELVNLVADHLSADLVQDQCSASGDTTICNVHARTVVKLSNFIEAQLISLRLGAQEDKENYRDEMEPRVPAPLRPGRALAKTYRLLRKQELRMAIIYLDRLEDLYPYWWELYDLKAVAFRLDNQPARMREALRKACKLGSQTACPKNN